MTADLQLAQAAHQGDAQAWNTFLERYSDGVLSDVVRWCEAPCLVPRSQYDCILSAIRQGKAEPATEAGTCQEGLALYRYAIKGLRERLSGYQGSQALDDYVRLALDEIRVAYMDAERGRLSLPAAVSGLGAFEQDVYRLSTRLESRSDIAARLGVAPEAVQAAEPAVRDALAAEGKAWGLTGSEPVQQVETPAWVSRQALDTVEAPDAPAGPESWQRKVLSQPDWLLGLLGGAVTTALILMVLIPRLDYVKAVREPSDQLIARAAEPLAPDVAALLAEARAELAKGQVDPAVQSLKAVIAARPDNQEARWLLATTYDRMGDQYHAAVQYRVFIDTEKRAQAVLDDRTKRAEARLESWEEVP